MFVKRNWSPRRIHRLSVVERGGGDTTIFVYMINKNNSDELVFIQKALSCQNYCAVYCFTNVIKWNSNVLVQHLWRSANESHRKSSVSRRQFRENPRLSVQVSCHFPHWIFFYLSNAFTIIFYFLLSIMLWILVLLNSNNTFCKM